MCCYLWPSCCFCSARIGCCKRLESNSNTKLLGFNRSTICRELKRNHDPDYGYNILIAHERTQRRQWIHHRTKIQRHSPLQQHILERSKEGWSPEQIAGRAKLDLGETWVSHETIYQYIYSKDGIKDELYKYLRDKRKRRYPKVGRRPNKRSLIPNRVSIHERPDSINNRLDFGHWEAYLIVFSQDKRANLLTLRERKSRFIIAIKNDNRSPDTIVANLFEKYRLRWRPPFSFHYI